MGITGSAGGLARFYRFDNILHAWAIFIQQEAWSFFYVRFSRLSHTTWECKYHVVFIPKYRRKTIYGKI